MTAVVPSSLSVGEEIFPRFQDQKGLSLVIAARGVSTTETKWKQKGVGGRFAPIFVSAIAGA